MSEGDLKTIKQIGAIASAARVIVGLLVACVIGIGSSFVWVTKTGAALQENQQEIQRMSADAKERVAEWSRWREHKDEIDTRTIALLEQLQKSQDRMMDRLERVEGRK